MSRWRVVYLVGRRELIERGRSKAFIGSLLLTMALIVGTFGLQAFFGGEAQQVKLGSVGEPSAPLRSALEASAAAFGSTLELTTYPDLGSAEQGLRDDRVDAVIVPPDVAGGEQGAGELIVLDGADARLQGVIQTAFQVVAQAEPVPMPSLRALEPKSAADDAAFFLANIGVVLLFISIFTFGYWVLTGVVEEKQSRVVEVVLATVRPRELLMGKVFGIGILGLIQLVAMVATGLGLAIVTDSLELPETTLSALAMLFLWFGLGYTLYSTAFAALGALASRIEEASNVTTPVMMIAVAAYLVALLVVPDDPRGLVATIATYVPASAPIVVPMRVALGEIEIWEVVLSGALTIAATYGLFVVGGRVYTGAVLQGGGRMKIRDAWRAAGR